MTEPELLKLLKQHEWKNIEFKEAKTAVPKNAYESVSAFANTDGGYLVFGVKKDGPDFEVVGVMDVDKVQNDFLTAMRQIEVDPKTMQRKDQPVDYVAFRQTIVNMLIHQDYSDHTRKPVIQHYKDLTRF